MNRDCRGTPLLYDVLLRVYPPAFRQRFGDEMRAAFAESHRAARRAGTTATIRLWGKTAWQIVAFAVWEWKDTLGLSRSRRERVRRHPPASDAHNKRREPLMSLYSDLRLAVRSLLRRPSFTIAALVTLALGIGANTAVFSVVHSVLWRPLPYEAPDELVMIWPDAAMNTREAIFLRERAATLRDIATVAGWGVALTGVDTPSQINGARTSANVFSLLGTPPLLGRVFRPDESDLGATPVVVLSHQLWLTRFGADSTVVGRSVAIDGESHEVVGVMPESFEMMNPTYQLWIPLIVNPNHWTYTGGVSRLIGRLAPGATAAAAESEFLQLLDQYRQVYSMPDSYGDGATLVDYKEQLIGNLRTMMGVLLGAVGFILLIAGSNLSSLMLSKAVDRRRDLALRSAMGATRTRLLQTVLTESALLSLVGGVLGLLGAVVGVGLLKQLLPADTPRISHIAVDAPVLIACTAFALGTGLLFSIAPALSMTRLNIQNVLGSLRGAAQSGGSTAVRQALVVFQVALAVMLVVGAGLMIQSVRRLLHVDPGFSADGVLTLRLAPGGAVYQRPEDFRAFYVNLVERLEALPNVRSAGGVQHLPLSNTAWATPVEMDGRPLAQGEAKPLAGWRIVTGHYFETMNIRLLEGRFFEATDNASSVQVGIVNRTMSERFWPDGSPLGKRLLQGRNGETLVTIIGVVDDVLHFSLDQGPVPELYRPVSQSTMPAIMMAVRTDGDPARFARQIRDEVWAMEPNLPISDVMPYEEMVMRSVGRPRLVMTLLTIFAAVALALGAIGVYGVAAFSVSRRTNEIGIRRALGATEGRVRREVLQIGVLNAAAGSVIGLIGAAFLARFLSGLVFEISTTDPATFAGVALFITVVAVAACYVPAWRATKIDPAIALRD